MPVLMSLAFTMPKTASDPVHIRRAKFIEKLEEQKLLLKDSAYTRTVQRMAEVDGQKQSFLIDTGASFCVPCIGDGLRDEEKLVLLGQSLPETVR